MVSTQTELLFKLNTIEEAIQDIKAGKLVIVVDDEDRENEGDFICSAECITPEIINFMAKYGRGLICVPIEESRAEELNLNMMVNQNTSLHETAFTVSVDLIGQGVTTGISTHDRAKAIKAMVNPEAKSSDFARPGHVFPLKAKSGGVLRRTGHTEAAIDLARLAGFFPAGVLVEILNDDGSMARLPQLSQIAQKHGLKIISIKDLVAYRMKNERIIKLLETRDIDTKYGDFAINIFEQITTGDLHIAIVKGEISIDIPTLVRVHSSLETGDIFGLLFDGYANQLNQTLELLSNSESGVLLLMRQKMNNDGNTLDLFRHWLNKKAISKTKTEEQRDFGVGAQILNDLGVRKIKLISNSDRKRIGLMGYGLEIVDVIHL